jgi:hypothetical protein
MRNESSDAGTTAAAVQQVMRVLAMAAGLMMDDDKPSTGRRIGEGKEEKRAADRQEEDPQVGMCWNKEVIEANAHAAAPGHR